MPRDRIRALGVSTNDDLLSGGDDTREESLQLLADGLALLYHEACHVRHLIKRGLIAKEG